VVAVDLTDRRMVVFPTDIRSHFGLDPDTFSIAAAVRMSMSIPVFYEPYRLTDARQRVHLLVDGGMLSTYPIWLLDKAADRQQRPLFGFKLYDELRLAPEHDDYPAPGEEPDPVPAAHFSQDSPAEEIGSLGDYLMAMVSIMLDSFDKYGVQYQMGDHERTVEIPTTILMDGIPKKSGRPISPSP
jgi:NTE family protein